MALLPLTTSEASFTSWNVGASSSEETVTMAFERKGGRCGVSDLAIARLFRSARLLRSARLFRSWRLFRSAVVPQRGCSAARGCSAVGGCSAVCGCSAVRGCSAALLFLADHR